jgi:hypothetical protein
MCITDIPKALVLVEQDVAVSTMYQDRFVSSLPAKRKEVVP